MKEALDTTDVVAREGSVQKKNVVHKGTPALVVYVYFVLYIFFLLMLARIGFGLWITEYLHTAPSKDIIKAFYVGIRFDLRIATFLTLPVALILTIPITRRNLYRYKTIFSVIYAVILSGIWSLYVFDVGFFSYLGERLSAKLFDLARDTSEGFQMLSESYPLYSMILGIVFVSIVTAIPLWFLSGMQVRKSTSRVRSTIFWLCGLGIFVLALWGRIGSNFFPLRWSNAYFSTNAYVTALALNPIQNIYDTAKAFKDSGFDVEKTKEVYPIIAELLQVDSPDTEQLNYDRSTKNISSVATTKKPNVVIIILESLAFPKTSLAPGEYNPTPNLKALAEESVLFTNFYSNARTTARGVFSTMIGIADVAEPESASRNQRIVDQRIVANEFQDYKKYYMIGGNTAWANIRAILGNNIQGIHILEESFWKSPDVDVWGVSDYHLFMEAHDVFAMQEKPFLAVIQAASFHKPHTIPKGLPNFTLEKLHDAIATNYGFESEQEYNSLRYVDYALGEFIRKAKQSPYYKDTIFIILGDHGIGGHSTNTTESYNIAQLRGWHVPLIVHAPFMLEPAVRNDSASQVDVFATAAGLAGISYTNWTMGRDLFSQEQEQDRGAFISGSGDVPIRYIVGEYCFYDNRAGGLALYKLTDNEGKDYKNEMPELFNTMKARANALQITSKYMLFNNKKYIE